MILYNLTLYNSFEIQDNNLYESLYVRKQCIYIFQLDPKYDIRFEMYPKSDRVILYRSHGNGTRRTE